MSIVVRSALPVARLPTLSIAAGVAVADALESVGVETRLKWPNDVLAGGRKIAGVLLERSADVVVLGIGINVTESSVPPDLATMATSVAARGGRADREALLSAVLDAVWHWRTRLEREGFEPVRASWTERAAMVNQRVSVDGTVGKALGLGDDGALLLATEVGITRVMAGDVLSG
jgi:BirA family biotin operon repressor/biotin-[acetyl-CoA-carboxylase] ligase